jgi:hypothetical protein
MSSIANHNLLVTLFMKEYSTVISNTTSIPCVSSYSHIVRLHADRGQCHLLLNTYTFAVSLTGSLYRNVTGIFYNLWQITSMVCVHMSTECWTSQGSLSCSPWKSVCHDWIPTDATHNCIPGCESILAVTAGWFISVCGFCLCGIRSWKSYVW